LLKLKSTNLALLAGDAGVTTYRLKTTDDRHVLAFLRKKGEREVLVVLNFSDQKDLHFDITDSQVNGMYTNVFSGAANDFTNEKSFEMQDWEFLVYEK
jgi:glycosidase